MFRLIFPSLHRRGRGLSGVAPILSDPRPKTDPKASAKISAVVAGPGNDPDVDCRLDVVVRWRHDGAHA
jgi:hypothetical protein